jgi:hypothetical protein
MSKPTWWKTFGSFATSAFFVFGHGVATKAKQIAPLLDARARAESCRADKIQPFVSTDLI